MRPLAIILLILLARCGADSKQEKVEEQVQPPDPVALDVRGEIVCFVYHRFGDARYPSTNVSIEDFEAHLSWLKRNNYEVLTLSDALQSKHYDSTSVKTAVITIDDGYKSFAENGLPLLKKYNFPATLFINTETIGSDDYMDWPELKHAASQGVEIGNHTYSHAYFLNEPTESRYSRLVKEIEDSQQTIEQQLGYKPKIFAYPYGEFDPEMKTVVKAMGFKAAAAQNSGVINSTTDIFELPRFPMSESYASMFEEKARMHAFSVIKKNPETHILSAKQNKPSLELIIKKESLLTDQMNCFVQGGKCKMKISNHTDSTVKVTLQSESAIADRRRTLYTITAPDDRGEWYWYSHLWINPAVK